VGGLSSSENAEGFHQRKEAPIERKECGGKRDVFFSAAGERRGAIIPRGTRKKKGREGRFLLYLHLSGKKKRERWEIHLFWKERKEKEERMKGRPVFPVEKKKSKRPLPLSPGGEMWEKGVSSPEEKKIPPHFPSKKNQSNDKGGKKDVNPLFSSYLVGGGKKEGVKTLLRGGVWGGDELSLTRGGRGKEECR